VEKEGESINMKKKCRSLLIIAHPDDEVLWFGSILPLVTKILVCFVDYGPSSRLSAARRELLARYPMAEIETLGLAEACSLGQANWHNPGISEYGLHLSDPVVSARYRANYLVLCKLLSTRIGYYKEVFTHNPWGEYGHEDHVQVFRVINALQEDYGFTLWVPAYVSRRSEKLAGNYRITGDNPCISYPIGPVKKRCMQLKRLYQRHQCWTWFDDWLPDKGEQTFLSGTFKPVARDSKPAGLHWIDGFS